MTHIVIVSGFAESLINFRGDLIRELVARGLRVTTLAPAASAKQVERIEALGAAFIPYQIRRNGMSVASDLATLAQLKRLFRELRPEIVLAYTIKPVIWSGIALFANPLTRFFPLITGLGFAFYGDSLRRTMLRKLVMTLYRRSLKRAEVVFFQNPDNQQTFRSAGLLGVKPSVVLPGSGINLERFPLQPLPGGDLVFLMIARLLGEKGVREYAAAAAELKQRFPNVQFRLVGPSDPSPDGIPDDEVAKWKVEGAIDYVGGLEDVREEITNCHVYVLPSYHEGLPRTVLEAMATGRPIITTQVPGCRETVVANQNGFLVEPRSVPELVQRMIWFIENRDAIEPMGIQSRRLAVSKFSVDIVNRTITDYLLHDRAAADTSHTQGLLDRRSQEIGSAGFARPS